MRVFGQIIKSTLLIIYALCGLALLVFIVPATGLKAKSVPTGSMRPAISPGSLVIIQSVPLSQLAVGDIITYRDSDDPKTTITHRIIKEEQKAGTPFYVTKGDANAREDAEIVGGQVVGRVIFGVPVLGAVSDWLKKPVGLLLVVVLPGLYVIYDEVRRLRQNLKRHPVKPENANPAPTPPASAQPTSAEVTPPASGPRRPPMDGMTRRIGLVLVGLLVLGVASTRAALQTNTVTLADSHLAIITIPLTAADCKNGGWQTFHNPDGSPMFKNQGQCIAFVNALAHGHCDSIHISNVGPGSSVTVVCVTKNRTTTINTTTLNADNSNQQDATSGSGTNTGNSSNSSAGQTSETVTSP